MLIGPMAFGGNNTSGPIDVATACNAHGGPSGRLDFESETFIADIAPTLTVGSGGRCGHGYQEAGHEEMLIAHTLRAEGFDASEDGTGRGTPLVPCDAPIPIDMRQASRGETFTNNRAEGSSGGAPGTGIGEAGDPAPSLSLSHPPAVALAVQEDNQNGVTLRDTAGSLRADAPGTQPCGTLVFQCHGSNVGPMGTIRSGNGNTAGGVPFTIHGVNSNAQADHAIESDTARCLDGMGGFAPNQGGTVVGDVIAFQERGRDGGPNLEHQADRSYSLNAPSGGGRRQEMNIAAGMAVRRLLPVECERLQGFPDGHTDVPFRGKPAKDGPRYKAVGNSMAVTVIRWLGRRVEWLRAQDGAEVGR